jgi:hypothetical protein
MEHQHAKNQDQGETSFLSKERSSEDVPELLSSVLFRTDSSGGESLIYRQFTGQAGWPVGSVLIVKGLVSFRRPSFHPTQKLKKLPVADTDRLSQV